eukprot:scaffold24900_cov132-Isochrysis_galbana.AAC.7
MHHACEPCDVYRVSLMYHICAAAGRMLFIFIAACRVLGCSGACMSATCAPSRTPRHLDRQCVRRHEHAHAHARGVRRADGDACRAVALVGGTMG